MRNGRDEITFIVGDYPQNVRQLIYDGKIFGTVDQDPYPQAYNAMKNGLAAFLNGKDADIPEALFPAVAASDEGERQRRRSPPGVVGTRSLTTALRGSPWLRRFGERADAVNGRVHQSR